MALNNNHIVIMAGGIGSRFWPMSTPQMPKQFIDVLGCGRTLLQLTVDRFQDIGLRIFSFYFPAYISNTRSGITATRLKQNMIYWNRRQLLFYNIPFCASLTDLAANAR